MKACFIPQEYLAAKRKYYEPKDIGFEKKIKERMEGLTKRVEREEK